jgi:hypothetical protein
VVAGEPEISPEAAKFLDAISKCQSAADANKWLALKDAALKGGALVEADLPALRQGFVAFRRRMSQGAT